MVSNIRFGKKIPMPSTIELKHELRLMAAADRIAGTVSRDEREQIASGLVAEHGLSPERARLLVGQLGDTGRQASA